MSKVMAVFEKPNGCSECPCLGFAVRPNSPVTRYCRLAGYTESNGKVTYDETIPEWCPLVEVEEQLPDTYDNMEGREEHIYLTIKDIRRLISGENIMAATTYYGSRIMITSLSGDIRHNLGICGSTCTDKEVRK